MAREKKRKTKLLIEIATAVLPVFILISALHAFLLFESIGSSYEQAYDQILDVNLDKLDTIEYIHKEWLIDYWHQHPDHALKKISLQEDQKLWDYIGDPGVITSKDRPEAWTNEWFNQIEDPKIQRLAARNSYQWFYDVMEMYYEDADGDVLFIISADPGGRAYVYFDECKDRSERYFIGRYIKVDYAEHPGLKDAINMNSSATVFERTKDFPHKGDYYIAYKPLIYGGKVKAFIGYGIDWNRVRYQANDTFFMVTCVSTSGVAIFFLILFFLIYRRAIRPVTRIQSTLREYTNDKDSSKVLSRMNDIKLHNEIGQLSNDISDLALEIDEYTDDIVKMTSENQRVATELDMARDIQKGQLPSTFPAFPERTDFDIYAMMTPAKEVGGDFYDFFLIDDDHLAMVIADVSGKGIPASLFMMMTKMMIHNYAMMGMSPHEVLEKTNEMICSNNPQKMFVTVWFGILEISTGKVIASNAGHEYPVLKAPGGSYELFKEKHGFVIGGLPNKKYTDYEFTLDVGGALFVYTDGIPEATDTENNAYGTTRMTDALNTSKDGTPHEAIDRVFEDLRSFTGDADQFDDITMMCVCRK